MLSASRRTCADGRTSRAPAVLVRGSVPANGVDAVLELIGPIAVQAALSLAGERTLDGASRKPEVR